MAVTSKWSNRSVAIQFAQRRAHAFVKVHKTCTAVRCSLMKSAEANGPKNICPQLEGCGSATEGNGGTTAKACGDASVAGARI